MEREERKAKRVERRASALAEIKSHPFLAAAYFILRLAVIAVLILQFFNGHYYNVFLCALTLLLFLVPGFFEKRLHIDVPNTLEVLILLFIFSAEILGEIQEYYLIFPFWDTMLHTINGFLMAAIGIAMVDILNRSEKFKVRLSPAFVALVAFCFSMTVGVLWEFFEYGMDLFFHMDMQKDTLLSAVTSILLNPEGRNVPVTVPIESIVVNGEEWAGYIDVGLHDTMKDLLVNFIGAAVFSVIGMLYIRGRGKGNFAPRFIPRLKKHELPPQDSEKESLLDPVALADPAEAPQPELFDLYTVDGQKLGKTVEKNALYNCGDYWMGVHMYLYDSKGRFLLQKRSEGKSVLPGIWDTHMGHVTAGETGREAALRELKEELGVEFEPESLVQITRVVWEELHSLLDLFFVRADLDESALTLQAEEVTAVKWVSKEEMAAFVRSMDYRPAEYREAVLRYMEHILPETDTKNT